MVGKTLRLVAKVSIAFLHIGQQLLRKKGVEEERGGSYEDESTMSVCTLT